ncbi:hypothetical protein [Paraglaciecola arctica]|uniref:hypothetical protein n=1 Tax=Paraglaciecola arctica TaxID=1128911 RepID=UPI001C06677E|nr:hypothetical protein [Paraglaciecola arctica]MBU3004269.1 hypothetical protein [Paraglaciecola arctica]
MNKVISTLAALLIMSGSANATIIDFESVTSDNFNGMIVADGFDWNFSASGWWIGPADLAFHPDGTSNGTSNLVAAGDSNTGTASVTMTQVGGGVFSIFGLDAATANINEINGLTINGMLDGGGTIFTTVDIDQSFDFYSIIGFTNLVSVTFSSLNSASYNVGGFSIDNIVLDQINDIPAPFTLSLLAFGLTALGASRRLKNL